MLRCVWGFDHVAKNVQETWIPTSGYSIFRKYAVANKGLLINDDGWLTCPPGNSPGNNNQLYVDCSGVAVAGMSSSVFALRVKILALGNTGPMLYVCGDSAGANYVQVLAFNQLPKTNVGDEMFIEIVIDHVGLNYAVYIDSVLVIGPVQIGAAFNNLLKSGQYWMAANLTNAGQSGLIALRDMFFLDNVTGDGFVGRQGMRRVQKIDFDVAAGTGWTTTDGSDLLAALKVAPETANPALLVAPTTKAPLALSMKSSIPDSQIIDAIMVMTAGKVDVAGAITKTQMQDGSASSAPVATQSPFTTTLKYGVPSGVFARHPSGARWNSANVDSASFVVLPDQVN